MKFLFDHNLPPSLARALNLLCKEEHEVLALVDRFPNNITDTELIKELSGWADFRLITADNNISRVPVEQIAWQKSGLTIIFLTKSWNNLKYWVKCWKLVKRWPDILDEISQAPNNKGFRLPPQGRITQI